jgi:hypothetical protein
MRRKPKLGSALRTGATTESNLRLRSDTGLTLVKHQPTRIALPQRKRIGREQVAVQETGRISFLDGAGVHAPASQVVIGLRAGHNRKPVIIEPR